MFAVYRHKQRCIFGWSLKRFKAVHIIAIEDGTKMQTAEKELVGPWVYSVTIYYAIAISSALYGCGTLNIVPSGYTCAL